MTNEELAGRVRAIEEMVSMIYADAITAAPDPAAAAIAFQNAIVARSHAVAVNVSSANTEAEILEALKAAGAMLDMVKRSIYLAATSRANAEGTAN